MSSSPDELADLYSTYDREALDQAIAGGPLQYTREAWIAICAECEKRGIPWDRPAEIPARRASPVAAPGISPGRARKRCRAAAIACGIPVALGALGAVYLILSDWNMVKHETEIFAAVVLLFGFLFLVVKKMWDGSPVALWTMGVMQAVVILMMSRVFMSQYSAHDLFAYVFVAVPVGLEVMVIQALMALREERKGA